jgi:hypothetical protein
MILIAKIEQKHFTSSEKRSAFFHPIKIAV